MAVVFAVHAPSSRKETEEHVRMGPRRSGHDARRLRVLGVPQLLLGGRSRANAHTHRPSGPDASADLGVRRRSPRPDHPRPMLFTAGRYNRA